MGTGPSSPGANARLWSGQSDTGGLGQSSWHRWQGNDGSLLVSGWREQYPETLSRSFRGAGGAVSPDRRRALLRYDLEGLVNQPMEVKGMVGDSEFVTTLILEDLA